MSGLNANLAGIGGLNGISMMDRMNELNGISQGIASISVIRARDGHGAHAQRIMPMNNYRAMYEFMRSIYPHEVLITDGFLRNIVQPLNGQTQFTFVVTKNDNGISNFSTNNALDQSDTFEALYFKFGIIRLPTTGPGNGILTAPATLSSAVPEYFVNKQVFTEAAEQQGLQGVYNGYLYVKIGTIVYFEQFEAANFKHVGQSQQGVAVSSVTTTGVISESSEHREPKALVTPVVMINGSGKNVFQLNLFDSGTYQPATADFTNYFMFECIGFKCQQGAEQPTMKFKVGTAALDN